MKPTWRTWLPAIFWMALIFITSCYFINQEMFLTGVHYVLRKATVFSVFKRFWYQGGVFVVKGWHLTEFAILFVLSYRFARRWLTCKPWQIVALCAGLCILYAISDEWHQTFVPGRNGTWVDVVIDTGGVLIAASITLWKARRNAKRSAEPLSLPPALTQAE